MKDATVLINNSNVKMKPKFIRKEWPHALEM